MFNKKYKKGMADAAKAYEAFGKKQEKAIEAVLQELRQGNIDISTAIQSLKGNIDNLYSYLESKEKAELYTVYTPFDIKELDKNERLFLVGALLRLTQDKDPTETQQNYLRSIQKYLEIKEPPFGIDLTAIENIENMLHQKAIYQVVLEYLILQDGDFYDETELQQEFLESFNLNSKNRQTIADRVDILYSATGALGLSEKYGYVSENDEEPEDSKPNNNDEKENDNISSNSYKGVPLKYVEEHKTFCGGICFETKDYFAVVNRHSLFSLFLHTKEPRCICYDKSSDIQKPITAIPDNEIGIFTKYVVDYNCNAIFYIDNHTLHRIDLENNAYRTYDGIFIDKEVQSMQLHGNWIVISTFDNLYLFDIQQNCIRTISDFSGKNIEGTDNTATVFDNKIFFYSKSGETLCSEDGGSLNNYICMYDIHKNTIKRVISARISKLFSANNEIYVIDDKGTNNLASYQLFKLTNTNNKYSLNKIIDFPYSEIKISDNYLLYYPTCDLLCKHEDLYSIFAFEFTTQTLKKVAINCYSCIDKGVFKSKWEKNESSFDVFGNWLYYKMDHIVSSMDNRDRCDTHIHRVNINLPLQAVDLGKK